MLFSEIYGNYYRTVAHILKDAVRGELDKTKLNHIVREEAFSESMMTIPEALLGEKWGLLTPDCKTPLKREPSMPLTTLEKRWMKALLLDPRIQLFGPDITGPEDKQPLVGPDTTGLEDIEPLWKPDQIFYYDRYTVPDPFTDPNYIRNFKCIRKALQEKKKLDITFTDGRGFSHHGVISPKFLEYSEKDDRFRLRGEGYLPTTINLARIDECRLTDETASFSQNYQAVKSASLTLELIDERKTLERFLLHFSHLKKETKRLDEKHYQVKLYYDKDDETEMLIRILSFGPKVHVTAPARFQEKLQERIKKQMVLSENG